MLISCEAIVLKTFDYSEADLMLMVLTDKLGKISIYSKNAKKIKSKIGQCSQLMSYSRVNLDCSGGMYKLHSGEVIDSFYNISSDIDRYYAAFYVMDIANKMLPENQGNIRAFKLLVDALRTLKSQCDIPLVKTIFRVKLLNFLGVKPVVERCISCGKSMDENFLFDFDESGCVCYRCSLNKNLSSRKYDMTTYKLMDYILENEFEKCLKAKVASVILKDIEDLLDKYYSVHF